MWEPCVRGFARWQVSRQVCSCEDQLLSVCVSRSTDYLSLPLCHRNAASWFPLLQWQLIPGYVSVGKGSLYIQGVLGNSCQTLKGVYLAYIKRNIWKKLQISIITKLLYWYLTCILPQILLIDSLTLLRTKFIINWFRNGWDLDFFFFFLIRKSISCLKYTRHTPPLVWQKLETFISRMILVVPR